MNVRKLKLKDVKKMEFLPAGWERRDSQRILRLPRGWRWLKMGEAIHVGDVMHDPRGEPITLIYASGCTVTDTHHPVRRKL